MERILASRIFLGSLVGLVTALAGCEPHPLLQNPTTTGTETVVVTPPGGQTYTTTHTVTMITLPTNTLTNIKTVVPTDTYTLVLTGTTTAVPTYTATNTASPTWTMSATNTQVITITRSETITQTSINTGTTTRSDLVTFNQGKAVGAMTGYGWVAPAPLTQVTSPTCGGTMVTASQPCVTGYTWNSPTALCLTGSIPALPIVPMQADYDNNWGVQLGVSAKESSGSIGFSFKAINIAITGQPSSGLRIVLHRLGDPDTTMYCAHWEGSAIPLSAFNTACWDNTGMVFDPAWSSKIDRVAVQVSSGFTAISVRNLCLTSIRLEG